MLSSERADILRNIKESGFKKWLMSDSSPGTTFHHVNRLRTRVGVPDGDDSLRCLPVHAVAFVAISSSSNPEHLCRRLDR